ncbi:REP-associated tyrosine transposase [Gracilimonas mengyeensis]|uniref:REP element-mobilizing transposase RayT n=1 Tax=Gracilimonas mengyeensis TaxID=1302730 RepID=A0A521DWP3_9BACT|nr:transposase [Gracilimonas mengyeensis]SMO76065.1 REP element-mobilizing transposase RayT [Gracilimonas mengyeensis]
MGRSRYKFHQNYYPYFITSSTVGGLPLFMNPFISKIILDALCYLQNENGVSLYGYVIMPNHLHLIAEDKELSGKLRAFKSFTGRTIVDYLLEKDSKSILRQLDSNKLKNHRDSDHQVWQEGLHPKQIFSSKMFNQKMQYIHLNPVNAGFVENPAHWRLSSAINYQGDRGVIPITLFQG